MHTKEATVTQPINIVGIAQRARRAAWQDGILEIFGGLFLLFYAVIIDDLARGVKPHLAVMLFMLLICSWPLIHLAAVRSAFTFPRIGYVETGVKVRARHVALLVCFLMLPLVTYVGVQFLGNTVNVPLMVRWMSVALGCVLGGVYLGLGRSQGDRFYFTIAAAVVIVGIILSQITRGTSALLALNSIILLLYGSYKLIRFIIRHPRAKGHGGGISRVEDEAGA
jgi:hypothetical protein